MKKEHVTIILWLILGFLVIESIDILLRFIVFAIYFAKSSLDLPYDILRFTMPLTIFVVYILAAFYVLKLIKRQTTVGKVDISKFPKKIFLICALIVLVLQPILNKSMGLMAEYSVANFKTNVHFFSLRGWMDLSLSISGGIVLAFLIFRYWRLLKEN